MIIVYFNRPDFEYDVHSLVKAFFPKDDVELYYTCPESEVAGRNVACTHRAADDLDRKQQEAARGTLEVAYGEKEVALRWRLKRRGPEGNVERNASLGQRPLLRGEETAAGRAPELRGTDAGAEAGEPEAQNREEEPGKPELMCEEVAVGGGPEELGREDVFTVDYADRGAVKNALKQHLYRMLAGICGRQLPWGSLTGIRPTKIAVKLLEEGADEESVAAHMRETYFASDGKIKLAIDIAKRERALLSSIDYENGYSLYIGIPFCPSTCLYCSFTSYPLASWRGRVDEYLDALEQEIAFAAELMRDRKLDTVYIGGGTPTTLEPYQLDRLIGALRDSFDLENCLEFTVEAGRPDSITREKLQVLREHGISRISINPQTMKQATLELIGRHHTVAQTAESFWLARELGFDNINMDLIIGLPDEELADVRHTMEALTELAPDNITVHSLAVKRAARLNIYKERYEKMQMVNTQEHMELCADYCARMGLFPYYLYRQKGMAGNMENVGYAKEGKAGLYNILINEEVQTIVALGAGSVTKRVYPDGTIKRCENVKDVAQYIARIGEMIERKRGLFTPHL